MVAGSLGFMISYGQVYKLEESSGIVFIGESIKLSNGRYEHEIFQDQACYTYSHITIGKYKLRSDTLCVEKPDSIIYTSTTGDITKVAISDNVLLFSYEKLDQHWEWIIEKNKAIKNNSLFNNYMSKNGFSIVEPTTDIIKLFGSPCDQDLKYFLRDITPHCLRVKKRRLIPLYQRHKPSGGISRKNFIASKI